MPSPLVAHPEIGFIHAGAAELDRQLREGDGMNWPGDPRLYLAVGVMENRNTKEIGRRYEVRRENEDGTDTIILHHRLEDFDRILFDLAPLRMDSPGYEPSIDKIDKANAEIDSKISTEIRDNLGAAMEYGAHLHHDLTEPGNVFRQVGGLRDETPEAKKPEDTVAS